MPYFMGKTLLYERLHDQLSCSGRHEGAENYIFFIFYEAYFSYNFAHLQNNRGCGRTFTPHIPYLDGFQALCLAGLPRLSALLVSLNTQNDVLNSPET